MSFSDDLMSELSPVGGMVVTVEKLYELAVFLKSLPVAEQSHLVQLSGHTAAQFHLSKLLAAFSYPGDHPMIATSLQELMMRGFSQLVASTILPADAHDPIVQESLLSLIRLAVRHFIIYSLSLEQLLLLKRSLSEIDRPQQKTTVLLLLQDFFRTCNLRDLLQILSHSQSLLSDLMHILRLPPERCLLYKVLPPLLSDPALLHGLSSRLPAMSPFELDQLLALFDFDDLFDSVLDFKDICDKMSAGPSPLPLSLAIPASPFPEDPSSFAQNFPPLPAVPAPVSVLPQYLISILSQPPSELIYRRALKPPIKVQVSQPAPPSGDQNRQPPPVLYLLPRLIRCDTWEEIPDKLKGACSLPIKLGKLVVFDAFRLDTTSHQHNDSNFSIRFELYSGDPSAGQQLCDVQSEPFRLVSHTTQLHSHPRSLPAVTKLIPDHGPQEGGYRVVMLGQKFLESSQLVASFGSQRVPCEWKGPRTLVCTVPPCRPGSVAVGISNDGVSWSQVNGRFLFDLSQHRPFSSSLGDD